MSHNIPGEVLDRMHELWRRDEEESKPRLGESQLATQLAELVAGDLGVDLGARGSVFLIGDALGEAGGTCSQGSLARARTRRLLVAARASACSPVVVPGRDRCRGKSPATKTERFTVMRAIAHLSHVFVDVGQHALRARACADEVVISGWSGR
jgi:hypothetical protein